MLEITLQTCEWVHENILIKGIGVSGDIDGQIVETFRDHPGCALSREPGNNPMEDIDQLLVPVDGIS